MALKEYKRVYENILAVEKKLDIARKHLVSGLGSEEGWLTHCPTLYAELL